ncbi:MAG: GGDEF domain-containing phosphodiesterase [Ruminococcus sp.]|nr:GGDEF domain-containing phosphodiesterase [Ruminococcus sp.]
MNNKEKNTINSNIGRSKFLPTSIIIILSFIILTICGMSYSGYMLDSLIYYKNSNYDSMAKTTANKVTDIISNDCSTIQDYANEICKLEYPSVNTYIVRAYLGNMVRYNGYSTMYIVNDDGIGFDYLNNDVDISNSEFFHDLDYTTQSIVCQDDTLLYIIPTIDDDNQFKFFIVAELPSVISSNKILLEDWNDMGFYILDSDKNVIAYSDDADPNFDYTSISYNDGQIYSSNQNDIGTITFSKFIKSIKSVLTSPDTYPTMWYEHSIGVNDWTIILGRSSTNKDAEVKDLLSLSIAMVSTIIATFIIILIIFMVRNACANHKLKKALYLDTVTGGTNWLKFKQDAYREIQKGKNRYALVSFDIYKYRIFCDIYGHKRANEVLVEIDKIMNGFIKRKEYCAHNTADNFDMFLLYTDEKSMRERLKEFSSQLSASQSLNGLRFAFGVYVADNKNVSINRMSTMANMSKDNDKLKDFTLKETISFFTKEMHDKIIRETEILKQFDDAILNEEFQLFVQPKYDLMLETLSAGEALVRWKKSDGTFISPAEFIPIFENNGCIITLDKYMVESVCKKQRKWLDDGLKVVPISVNLSRASFADKTLAKNILRLVDSYKLSHNLIELEVTESAFFDNKELLIDTVKKLRSYGFSVSIDDFGAGYSSLNSLKELPIDIVKLDGGFFRDIDNQDVEKSNIIVYNTIRLAHELGVRVVAEGVETTEQINYLRSLGYNILIQSYYYSKPIPSSEFEDLIKLSNQPLD